MGAVDIINCCLQTRSEKQLSLHLRMFFDLIDVAPVNSHVVYTKLDNDISLPNFKIVVEKDLIGTYNNCKRSFPTSSLSKQKHHEPSTPKEVRPSPLVRVPGEANEMPSEMPNVCVLQNMWTVLMLG